MKKLILILITLLISIQCFAQDSEKCDLICQNKNDLNWATRKVSRNLTTFKMVLTSTKKSEIINQVSDLITDLYVQMHIDLVKKGFTEEQSLQLIMMTFEELYQVIKSFSEQ